MTEALDNEIVVEVKRSKKKLAQVILLIIAVLAVTGGIMWWNVLRTSLSTDNAKVTGDIVDVSFRVGGRLDQLLVKEGDTVKVGQTLAQLDSSNYKVVLEQAQAGLDLANATAVKLPYDIQALQSEVEKSQALVASARAQVNSAQVALADAQRVLDKDEVLFQQGAISQESLDTVRSRYTTAQATLAAAQAGVLSAQSSLNSNQQKLEAANASSPALSKAQVDTAKASYESAKLNYDNTVIKSTVNGSVLRLGVQVGENVAAGQSIVTISNLSSTWVVANIEEKEVARVKEGQKVDVKIDAYPGKVFQGKITTLGEASQATFSLIPGESASGNFTKVTQRIPVKISVENLGLELKPGMSAVVKIYTRN